MGLWCRPTAHGSSSDCNPARFSLGYSQEFGGGARQAIEPGHHKHVTFAELFDQLLQLWAIAVGAREFFFEQLFASGGHRRIFPKSYAKDLRRAQIPTRA